MFGLVSLWWLEQACPLECDLGVRRACLCAVWVKYIDSVSGSVCCSSDSEAKTFSKKDGMACCGSAYEATKTSTCCDGNLHKYTSALQKAQLKQVCCGANVIKSGAGCCNGKEFDAKNQVCADRATDGDGDTCGVGAVCPASKKDVSYCDQCNFNIDKHVCARVDNKALTIASDEKRTKGGGVVHNPTLSTCKYTQCKLDGNICAGVCYGDKKVCCGGKLHDKKDGLQCCGTGYVKKTGSQVCCGNGVFNREADKKCCGDAYKVVKSGQVCCEGSVGTPPFCPIMKPEMWFQTPFCPKISPSKPPFSVLWRSCRCVGCVLPCKYR